MRRSPSLGNLPAARLAAGALWVLISVLLVRIASGGNLADWAHVYHETPRLFLAEVSAALLDLAVVALTLWRPTGAILLSAAAWSLLLAVFGVVLVGAHDRSGVLITTAAMLAAWLTWRSARGAHPPA